MDVSPYPNPDYPISFIYTNESIIHMVITFFLYVQGRCHMVVNARLFIITIITKRETLVRCLNVLGV